jgi:hypothetical protein
MMIRSMKRLVWGGLLVAGVVIASGCDRGARRPTVSESAIVGTWVEMVEKAAPSPRVRARPESKYVRRVTLNADKTFEFSLRTKSGEETKFKSEGTWAIEEGAIVFKVTSSTFPENDERADWAPESSVGVRQRDVSGEGTIEVLPIVDLEGMVVDFKRAP